MGWHLEVLIKVHEFDNLHAIMSSMAVDVSFGHLGYMKTDNPISHPGFQALLNLLRDGKGWAKLTGSYRITTSVTTPYDDVAPYAKALIADRETLEVLEPVWMALPDGCMEKCLIQGLIQLANGCLKLRMNRPNAAARLVVIARELIPRDPEMIVMSLASGTVIDWVNNLEKDINLTL